MKIGIIGLGLIGGSLGLDLTRQGYDVVGVSRQLNTCNIAIKKNIVRDARVDFSILEQTDLIFVCTPINFILPTIKQIINYIPSHTIITDVGSVKGAIVHEASQLWQNFVGSHPMAGTANQGIEAAQSHLFDNAPCVITPVNNTSVDAMSKVSHLWRSLGCKIYNTTPEIHDEAVAWISHLPVIISANLIHSCLNNNLEVLQLAKNLASSGFKDTSRVGGGNVELGLMMAQYNRQQLLISLKEYQKNLGNIINNIEQEKWEELTTILTKTHQERPNFMQ